MTLGVTSSFESVREPFDISDVKIPAGEYWFHESKVEVRLPRTDVFRGQYTASAGSFYGGTRYSTSLNPAWNVSKYVELGGGYEVNRLNFAAPDASATLHLARLKVQTALNPNVSMSTFAQYNSVTEMTSFNVRFRYHFREGDRPLDRIQRRTKPPAKRHRSRAAALGR